VIGSSVIALANLLDRHLLLPPARACGTPSAAPSPRCSPAAQPPRCLRGLPPIGSSRRARPELFDDLGRLQVENESRQSWVLIGIATVGLALGVIALIVAFDARSSADDAASQKSVDEVSTQLSNLIDRLGITEESLTGEQKVLQGKAQKVEKETRDAVANLTKRVNKLEHQNASAEEIAKLTKKIESLETQVANVNSRVTATNKRVNQLSARVNEGG
jgi:hypothetical protein